MNSNRNSNQTADYIAVIIAKVFLVSVFLMGMSSLVLELVNGTLPL
jgi:hypothetical protein